MRFLTVDEPVSCAWSYDSHANASAWRGLLRLACILMAIRVRIELSVAVYTRRKVATYLCEGLLQFDAPRCC